MIYENEIDPLPVPDSPNNDALEVIIELYYQLEGHITSAGKWFWAKEKGKQQRGYQDIDILAINKNETIIVSVTSNLDDKIGFNKGRILRSEQLENLVKYFNRVENYFRGIDHYSWLVNSPRTIKYHLVYLGSLKDKTKMKIINDKLTENKIQVKSVEEMLKKIIEYLDDNKNLKVQNPMLRTFQVLKEKGLLN